MTFSSETIFAETLQNLRANKTLSYSLFLISLLLGLGGSLLTASEVGGALDRYHHYIARGGNVAVIRQSDGEQLDAARCEALRTIPGVRAAGGRIATERITSPLASTFWLEAVAGTPGYAEILWPDEALSAYSDGVTVGATVADRFGLVPNSYLPVDLSTGPDVAHVGATAGSSERGESADATVFFPRLPVGQVQECYVESEPDAARSIGNVLVGWFDVDVAVAAFYEEADPPSADELHGRFSVQFALIVGAACGTLYAFSVISRRMDFALYRTLGMTRGETYRMMLIESVTLCVCPLLAGLTLAILLGTPADPLTLSLALVDALRSALTTLAVAGVAAVVATRLSYVAQMKGA